MRIDLGNQGFVEVTEPVMEPVEQIMRMFEAHFEGQIGWDAKPMYFYLFRNPSGSDPEGIGAVNLPMPEELYQDPGGALPVFARYVAQDDVLVADQRDAMTGRLVKMAFKTLLPETFYGVGVLNEGWSAFYTKAEELQQAIDDGRALPPIQRPDRVEVRMVHVVTTDGRVLGLVRQRGETPVFAEFGPGINEDGNAAVGAVLQGRVPTALRLLCDGLERVAHAS